MADPRVVEPVRPTGIGVGYEYPPGATTEEVLLAEVERLSVAIGNLENAIRSPKRHLPVTNTASGNTTAAGVLVLPVYQVGQGFIFHLVRLNVECATFDATNPRTPAAPYANAACWLGMFESPNPNAVGQGWMFDFLPTVAGGQVLPAVAEYPNGDQASGGVAISGGNYIVLNLAGGPASQRISVRYQGWLESTVG
jgi:hypothetical protein